eukprot:GHVU01055089.1.p1 GENE.GHVU01055089.1~~GHVU01055089.1.p1  ORF type:complete len:141 (-),score=1.21 GHVU01055089.1:383-805(-)
MMPSKLPRPPQDSFASSNATGASHRLAMVRSNSCTKIPRPVSGYRGNAAAGHSRVSRNDQQRESAVSRVQSASSSTAFGTVGNVIPRQKGMADPAGDGAANTAGSIRRSASNPGSFSASSRTLSSVRTGPSRGAARRGTF